MISWQLSLMYVVILPVIGTLVTISSRHVRRISHKLQNTMKQVISTAQENLDGYREIRAFGAAEFEAMKIEMLIRRLGTERIFGSQDAIRYGLADCIIKVL